LKKTLSSRIILTGKIDAFFCRSFRPEENMPKKILIVDDDPDVRLFLSTLLKDNGFDTVEASDGRAGLEKALSEAPSLILLDLMMPRKSGIAMLSEMRSSDSLRAIPVILVTGISGETGTDLKGFLSRGDFLPAGVIEKPVDSEELIRTVKEALGKGD
jgi:twitching motility two-component system response regulator PilH